MPETIAPSPATSGLFRDRLLLRQFRRLGTVADGGRQALEMQWDFASSRRAPTRPLVAPRKTRGSVTHGKLRCNMTKRPAGLQYSRAKTLPERASLMIDRRASPSPLSGSLFVPLPSSR